MATYKNKLDSVKIIDYYTRYSIEHYLATYEGNPVNANRAFRKIEKLRRLLSTDLVFSSQVLLDLLKTDIPAVQIWACAHSLELGVNIDKAIKTLQDLVRMPNDKIISFDAKMTLQQWRKGKLSTHEG